MSRPVPTGLVALGVLRGQGQMVRPNRVALLRRPRLHRPLAAMTPQQTSRPIPNQPDTADTAWTRSATPRTPGSAEEPCSLAACSAAVAFKTSISVAKAASSAAMSMPLPGPIHAAGHLAGRGPGAAALLQPGAEPAASRPLGLSSGAGRHLPAVRVRGRPPGRAHRCQHPATGDGAAAQSRHRRCRCRLHEAAAVPAGRH